MTSHDGWTVVIEVPAELHFEGVWLNLRCVYWPVPASPSPDPAAQSACHNPPSGSIKASFKTALFLHQSISNLQMN